MAPSEAEIPAYDIGQFALGLADNRQPRLPDFASKQVHALGRELASQLNALGIASISDLRAAAVSGTITVEDVTRLTPFFTHIAQLIEMGDMVDWAGIKKQETLPVMDIVYGLDGQLPSGDIVVGNSVNAFVTKFQQVETELAVISRWSGEVRYIRYPNMSLRDVIGMTSDGRVITHTHTDSSRGHPRVGISLWEESGTITEVMRPNSNLVRMKSFKYNPHTEELWVTEEHTNSINAFSVHTDTVRQLSFPKRADFVLSVAGDDRIITLNRAKNTLEIYENGNDASVAKHVHDSAIFSASCLSTGSVVFLDEANRIYYWDPKKAEDDMFLIDQAKNIRRMHVKEHPRKPGQFAVYCGAYRGREMVTFVDGQQARLLHELIAPVSADGNGHPTFVVGAAGDIYWARDGVVDVYY